MVLRLILLAGDLGTVALIQHLLGLAMAVALYAVLLRRGAGRWLAAAGRRAGAAGRLSDADGADDHARRLVRGDDRGRAGRAALAARGHRAAFAVAAGLILGSSATVKQLGELLVLPAVVYLLVGRRATCAAR